MPFTLLLPTPPGSKSYLHHCNSYLKSAKGPNFLIPSVQTNCGKSYKINITILPVVGFPNSWQPFLGQYGRHIQLGTSRKTFIIHLGENCPEKKRKKLSSNLVFESLVTKTQSLVLHYFPISTKKIGKNNLNEGAKIFQYLINPRVLGR